MNTTPTGLTKDQGWEIGVRHTLPIDAGRAWELVTTAPGLDAWLKPTQNISFAKDISFPLAGGGTARVVSFEEGSLIRMRVQLPGHNFESTLQLRLLPAATGTTFAFHHDRLQNASQREEMRGHWQAAIDALEKLI